MNHGDSRCGRGAALGARLENEDSQSFTDACDGPGVGWALGGGPGLSFSLLYPSNQPASGSIS